MSDNWIKSLGMGARGHQLRDDWGNERDGLLRRALTFARRPGLANGDGVVLYAAGVGLFFAVGKVTSHPYLDETDTTPWPWRVHIELDQSREFLHDGEPLELLNVEERDLRKVIKRRSHIRLSEAEFEAAVRALRA
ncbi:MAG: hypothetical protein FVQ78_00695 [Solirubrobacterales bacterium]|nr:hypothetical protein [Solirubrobacterales bacterium]